MLGISLIKAGAARAGRRAASPLTVVLASFGLGACGDVLDVSLPGELQEESARGPEFAELFVTSAVGAFECVFGNYALVTGNIVDEMYDSGSLENFIHYDQRTFTKDYGAYATAACTSVWGIYTPLHQARFLADDAFRRVKEATDAQVANRNRLMGTAAAYAGYSYTLMGEGMCEAAIDGGPALKPKDVLALAEQRFTTAIDLATQTGDAATANMARVGRARVRLDLANKAGAAADARLVPRGFVKLVTRESANNTRWNKIYRYNAQERQTSIAVEFWNLTEGGVPDPRVDLNYTGTVAFDGRTKLVVARKFTALESPMRLATYEEARLIQGEAEGGQTALDVVNELHAAAKVPAFTGSTAAALDHLIKEERRRVLFLEGHRMNDVIRHNLGFPSGRHPFNERFYGNSTCFPLPSVEINNNPNLRGS